MCVSERVCAIFAIIAIACGIVIQFMRYLYFVQNTIYAYSAICNRGLVIQYVFLRVFMCACVRV